MRSACFLLALLALLLGAPGARAQAGAGQEDGFADIASGSCARIAEGATALAAAGAPRAGAVLHALQSRHLLAARKGGGLYVRENGALTDARTGAPVATAPEGLRPVRPEGCRSSSAVIRSCAGSPPRSSRPMSGLKSSSG